MGKNKAFFSLYFSIPFHINHYEKLMDEKYDSLKKAGWVPSSLPEGEQDLYDHIVELMSKDNPNAIGSAWEFTKVLPMREGMPGVHKCFQTRIGDEYISWDLGKIGMVLFDTAVGIVWYEIKPKAPVFERKEKNSADMEQIFAFISKTKELSRGEKTDVIYDLFNVEKESFDEKDGAFVCEINTKEGCRIDARRKINLFDEVIYPTIEALEIDSYFANRHRNGKRCPDRGLPFVYVLNTYGKELEKEGYDADGVAVRLSRGYDKKYGITEETGVYQPFDYSAWSVSVEGCANYVYPTENIEFFTEGEYRSRLSNYFYLYMLCMGQYYSLLQFSQEVCELPIDEKEYSVRYNAAEDMLDRIHLFKLKNMYTQVGHITQHNGFYEYLQQEFKCEKLHEELEIELESLSRFVAKKQEEKKEKRIKVVSIISGLFVFVQTLLSIAELYNIIVVNGSQSLYEFVVIMVMAVAAIGVLFWLLSSVGNYVADRWAKKKRRKR